MEQAVVSAFTEILASIVAEKLFQEVSLVTSFRDEFEFICEEVNSIKCILNDARGKARSNSITHWLDKLQDFLYDAVDVVEECEDRKSHFRNLIFRHRMGSKIKILKERISKIHKSAKYLKYATYVLDADACAQPLNVYEYLQGQDKRRKSSALLNNSQVHMVGLDHDIDVISRWILEDSEGFGVIAVVGMGGLGKTLVVQHVFNSQKVRDRFDHLVWLAISPKVLVKQLLLVTARQMKLSEEDDHGYKMNEVSEEELRDRINKHLQGKNKNQEKKRCLFVLDDVWDKDAFEKIGLQLSNLNSKNKIVVTTRDNIVAEAMGAHHTHHMKFLSRDNSWKLFCFHANFPTRPLQEAEDERLTSIARDIVQKCSGLPLAIKPIAASMARLRRVPNEWQSTLDRLNDMDQYVNEADTAINDRVMPSLRLSYQALPALLKPCFLYCSAFPPNTQIKSEYLVHVWMAEGFISSSSSSSSSSIQEAGDALQRGRSYIEKLINRCMIGWDGRVKYCQLHDILHDLALMESHKESSCLLKPGKELKELPIHECQGVRRISLIKNDISTIKEAIQCPLLRTLLLWNNTKLTSIPETFFDKLKYLVVLDLSQTSIGSLPTSIGNAKQLKFLNLSGTNILMLPETLRGLKRLQFLDVSRCRYLSSLHTGIGAHKYMVHLNVKGCKNLKSLPRGISNLIYLRTLKGARVFKRESIKAANAELRWTDLKGARVFKRESSKAANAELQWMDLKGLTRLQDLSITVTAIDGDQTSTLTKSSGSDLEGTFGGMTNMTSLSFENTNASRGLLTLPKDMEQMEGLEIVRLTNCAVPKWVFELENLMVLVLNGDNSSAEYRGLQKISNLKKLRLSHNNQCVGFPVEFGEPRAFPKLEILTIEQFNCLENFPSVQDTAMPMLKFLRIKMCNQLKQMPQALQRLTNLEEIEVECCPKWEDGLPKERASSWSILRDRGIKLTIDNFVVSTGH